MSRKLFVGIVDFFSILLPGALLTFVLQDAVGPRLLGVRYGQIAGTEGWITFLFSSYLLGHFVFLLGSWIFDERVYDPIRRATYEQQVIGLTKGRAFSPALARWLAARFIEEHVDEALRHAVRIKEYYLDPLGASSTINAFQWCKSRLTLEHPEAIETVQHFEAHSKFFRSLLVVLCILIPWGLAGGQPTLALVSVPMLAMAFWRYVDQRVKSTNHAYWYIITLESQREGGYRPPPAQAGGASHAGGVVYRRKRNQVDYLLVQAKDAPQKWVLPKGHIEPGEETMVAAVREVQEESGVWACIKSDLGDSSFTVNAEPVKVRFYLMEAVKEEKPSDTRDHVWLPLNEAVDRATHDETKNVLRQVNPASQEPPELPSVRRLDII